MTRLFPLLGLLLLASPARAETESARSAHATPAGEGTVNLNEASAEELERLPGIGPSKANAILDYRKAHPFRKIEDLVKVRGIGRKTFAKLRPYLSLAGKTTLTEGARGKK